MGISNHLFLRDRAFVLTTQEITTDYTVQVGGPSDNFHEDRVIKIGALTSNITITVPDAAYFGQELLICLSGAAGGYTVTVSTDTGSDYSFTAAGDYASLEYVNDTSGWVALCSQET